MSETPTLSIAAGCLGFAAPFCATGETRYYLNGVFVEPGKSGAVCVATDGHTMIALRDETGHAARPAILQPGKGLAALCRKAPDLVVMAKAPLAPKADVPVWLVPRDSLHAEAASGDPAGAVTVIDGEFPEWRRVFPARVPQGALAAGIQARFYDRFRGPAEWSSSGKAAPISVVQDGEGPALVTPGHQAFGKSWAGLIMPMRCDPVRALPKWLGKTGIRP